MATDSPTSGFRKLGEEDRHPGSERFMAEADIIARLSIRSDVLSRDAAILIAEKNAEIASLRRVSA